MKMRITFALLLSCVHACAAPAPAPAPTPQPSATPTQTMVGLVTASPAEPTETPEPSQTPAPTPTYRLVTGTATSRPPDPAPVGQDLTFSGQVADATSFSEGFKFRLDNGIEQITLLTWLETYDGIAERDGLRPGASVQVTGRINDFEGELQIIPFSSADIVILEPGRNEAPERQTGSLSTDDVGTMVAIQGEVKRVETFSRGARVFLDDGSGEVLLLLWGSISERMPDGGGVPTAGCQVRATGRVAEYQGALEVVPALPYDVETLSRAAVSTPLAADVAVSIGNLDAGHAGEEVTIVGQVMDTVSFSRGFKFTVADGTGQIVLLTWHDVYDALPEPSGLNIGATVHVKGEIREFEDELQIHPESSDEIKVTEPVRFVAPQRDIASISDFLGQRVSVTGQVARITDTSSGTRVFVADDTGEGLVYIWENVMERIADEPTLREIGTQVRITGVVQEYQGELEIVPSLPTDVDVLK
jgi:DNA/RNA endonuclease YhcR with UshA esterase domain